jgi:hypothetical protein
MVKLTENFGVHHSAGVLYYLKPILDSMIHIPARERFLRTSVNMY